MAVAGAAPPVPSKVGMPPTEISRSRKYRNRAWWSLCSLGMICVVIPVVWILGGVFDNGVRSWHWSVLWTAQRGVGGGLANDIVGTALITFGVAIFAGVVGVGCGLYLSEFLRPGVRRTILRSAYEVLSGIPSIVFGYVGYVALDVGLHWQFSLLAALIVLSMLVVPYIAKATEIALGQVPTEWREGADSLGMAKSYQLRKIVMKAAIPGMLTGFVVADPRSPSVRRRRCSIRRGRASSTRPARSSTHRCRTSPRSSTRTTPVRFPVSTCSPTTRRCSSSCSSL